MPKRDKESQRPNTIFPIKPLRKREFNRKDKNVLLTREFILFLVLLGIVSCETSFDTDITESAPVFNHVEDLDSLKSPSLESLDSVPFSFLHISDTHGDMTSLKVAVEYLDTCDACRFGLVTGDVIYNKTFITLANSTKKPVLFLPGNHDAYDQFSQEGQYQFRHSFLDKLESHKNVEYGDPDANYYFCDFEWSGEKYRLICLDQYEIDTEGKPANKYYIVMSQKQVDWLINTLSGSYSCDGIFIGIHAGFGNRQNGNRDVANSNKFISSLSARYTNSYDYNGISYPLMIPEIINAYQTGENLHWDEIEYIRDFPLQLQMLVAYGGSNIGSTYNDLTKDDAKHVINKYVIDSKEKKIIVYRIGARNTISGVVRDSSWFRY